MPFENMIFEVPGGSYRRVELEFDDDIFPFPYIPSFLRIPTVAQDHTSSTSENSFTQTSSQVNNLADSGDELVHLYRSDSLWKNFIAYGDPHRPLPGTQFNRSTLGITPHGRSEANPQGIAESVWAMCKTAEFLAATSTETVNSQDAIQKLGCLVVSKISGPAIGQRYLNQDNGVEIPVEHRPQWRSNVLTKDHAMDVESDDSAAGASDAILSGGNLFEKGNAVLQCKPHWVYKQSLLDNIFVNGGLGIVDANGVFRYNGRTVGPNLIRQLWGSMKLMGCKFSIWTNGQKVFLAVMAGTQALVCTPPQDWSDRDTARAIIGLTYAALDSHKWDAEPHNINLIAELIGAAVLISPEQ